MKKEIEKTLEALKNDSVLQEICTRLDLFNDCIIINKLNSNIELLTIYINYSKIPDKKYFNVGVFKNDNFLIGCEINNVNELITFIKSIH